VIGAAAPVMSCGVCPQGCGNSTAAPAGMRSERLEFLASGVSAEKEIKTTWRRNASDQDVQNAS